MILLGHSAGGQLALWVAAVRHRLDTRLGVGGVVSLAGVTDLVEAARRGTADLAVLELMAATPEEEPDLYRDACPAVRFPIGVPIWCVQGLADLGDLIDMNRRFVAAAEALDERAVLVEVEDNNHFDVIDPSTESWQRTCELMGW